MKKSAAALAAASLVGGLLALAPTSAHAATCDDPDHPIEGTGPSPSVSVGTTKTQTMDLSMTTVDGCRVSGGSVTVTAPRSTKKVTLHQVDKKNGLVYWEGSTAIRPTSLKNSDAGTWALTYRATGTDSQTLPGDAQVRRATRLSFNAGPEPVQDGTLTYTGTLERANWGSHHYDGYRQHLTIEYLDDPHGDGADVVAALSSKKNGTFTVTQKFQGPGDYSADFAGTSDTAGKHSRYDSVSG